MSKKLLIPFLVLLFLADSFILPAQNPRIDGYKGIWYSFGQLEEFGYKFSGGVATFASRHRPMAIYAPEVRKTFFVYGGTTGPEEQHLVIMVSYYDHRLNKVPKPVVVYDKMGVKEPQDNASLSIDKDGYLWVFVSGRGRTRPGLIFKSSKPWSIDSFDKIMEWEMISPQPWWMEDNGFMLMFSRNIKGRELYFSSSADGKTWADSQKIAAMGGHFQVSNVKGKKLVTVFNYHPGGNIDRRTNLYLLQTDDMGRTWKTVDNRIVTIPVTDVRSEALIKDYEAEGKLVYISDLDFDNEGNPVVLVILSSDVNPGPKGGPREWMIITRKNNNWNFSKVCESYHNYDMGALYITDNEWRIIGPTEPGPQKYGTGGEIALWISRDKGISWEKVRNITSNSTRNNSFVRNPVNAQKDFYALWTDGDADKFSTSCLYFTNENCDKVWVLPYEMMKNFQKPLLIRSY